MKPDVPVVMGGFLGSLAMDIAPNLNGEYSAGNASTMGLALFFVGQEFERAAEIRVRENGEMRSLFADAQSGEHARRPHDQVSLRTGPSHVRRGHPEVAVDLDHSSSPSSSST